MVRVYTEEEWKDHFPEKRPAAIDELEEMATLRKKRSGLPVNLYLDDSMSYKRGGHAKRIKFQPDKGDRPNTREMIPMSISDDPKIMGQIPKTELSSQDIERIRAFVIANKKNLDDLADMKMDIGDFLDRMQKV
jgi:hypothetical protein